MDAPSPVERRTLLKAFPALALSLVTRGMLPPLVASTPGGSSDVIDEALDLLERYGPEYGGGLSNHAPMACEALVALNRPDAVLPWIERYRGRLQEPPGLVNRITDEEWREALGDERRVGDWTAWFERELARSPWQKVLETWIPRLAPGLVGAAAHCVIRTGHATRRVAASKTPQRLRELARGLGYWAARYHRLPGRADGGGELSVAQAVARAELLPPELRRPTDGLIVDRMAGIEDSPGFEAVINTVDPSRGEPDFLSDLTRVFTEIYLQSERNKFVFIHSVTGPGALRLLAPYVKSVSRAPASLYAWQAAAGMYVRFAGKQYETPPEAESHSPEDLIDRAVANGSAHAIKFTEVCLREWKLNPQPVYLTAALDSTEFLRPLR